MPSSGGVPGGLGDPLIDPVARDLPGRRVDAIPGVDAGNRDYQGGQLGLVVMPSRLVPDAVRNRIGAIGEPGGRLGQRQRSALGIAEYGVSRQVATVKI